ncbi:sugar phosphate isomerase/epimerase family protein [Paenibacillus allorhizosphaerae]|uniref:Xylose isomerase-like TIM barrel domain-containing protein n=1 Tax=Paenibacillus allorhizosphaerae TaxID=2849866 RepID=A0ABN7TC19_9BACL|nr:sugar phosphate isomerase/epimerase [Paenibacillus allorhizosphaerae]CAG7617945.1 hypothetical protein PAECIP111802_00468 [Paenibacillus allorhizosphaerae]
MRLSTSTNIFTVNRNGGPLTDTLECIRHCAEVGYSVLDIDFRFVRHPEFFLIQDDWEWQFEAIGNEANKHGIEFSQSHMPFYDPFHPADPYYTDPELRAWFESMCERAYYASSALGVKWAVVHGFTAFDKNGASKASKQQTIAYYSPYLELAKRLGVGIAFENMYDAVGPVFQRRYTASYEELVDLVQSFHDEAVGICWDFGHANMMKYDQCEALRYIGKHLKATHVSDNFGEADTHQLPFMGTAPWEDIMKTLAEIGYNGDLTFEVYGATNHLPASLKQSVLRLSHETGQYLLSLQQPRSGAKGVVIGTGRTGAIRIRFEDFAVGAIRQHS